MTRQPLTKADCVGANVKWNEGTNVCDLNGTTATASAKGASPTAATAAKDQSPAGSSILITIDKSAQRMTIAVDGTDRYTWPVSTGRPIYATPSGTYTPLSMNEVWFSKEWDNAPMPHAIFFMKDGHAIHGSYEVKTLGKPVSHGCVRISPQNAIVLYGLVKATGLNHTEVVLTGTTPGGEEKVAGTPRSSTASRYTLAPDVFPQRRGGFFRRLFGGQ
jgi:lipoprotein-anchoring transpeptidase ErfK/SrfK